MRFLVQVLAVFGLAIATAIVPVAAFENPAGTDQTVDGGLPTRAFVIHHKDLDDLVTLIRPALSEDASILIQSKIKTVTVTDHAPNLEAVAALVEAFDLPPHDVAIQVNLIKASRDRIGPRARMPVNELPSSLKGLTRWLDYQLLGGMSIQTTESERSSLSLGEEYRIRFQTDLVDDRAGKVRLADFSLERRVRHEDGSETYIPIFDTVVNLRSGVPYVFGATRGENAKRALFLTITAKITP